MRISLLLLSFLIFQLGVPTSAQAERIQERLPDGLLVNADYQPAATDKPAILVLHGFLQTFDFLATRSLINGLSTLDYTVLAPNLSLGIPDRKQSVQCNAAHTHTDKKDLTEIDFWVQWLQKKGYRSIILLGHSWGSQHILGYMDAMNAKPIIAVVAISLVRTRESAELQKKQLQRAKSYKKNHDKSLHPYEMGFCKEFMATPDSYISYAKWTDQYVLKALSSLQKKSLPVYVIVGGKDKRIDGAWLAAVKSRVSKLVKIDNANHFFSHVSEFDLNDQLEILLSDIGK